VRGTAVAATKHVEKRSRTPVSEDDAGTGADLESVAFSPSGGLLATANNSGTLSVFQVAANGVLTTVSEDYASTGLEPHSVVFSPSGGSRRQTLM